MPLTWLDILLIGIMAVSGLLAMMRGFLREALSVLAWIGALVATWVMYPILKQPVRDKIDPDYLADILVIAGVFIFVLVVISIITMRFADAVLESRIGALDRTLGFLFGLLRGFVLVVIAYLFFAWLVSPPQRPQWVQNARSLPYIVDAGDYIRAVLPEDLQDQFFDNWESDGTPEPVEPEREPGEQPGVIPENSREGNAGGYRNSERSGLNQLLESSSAQRR
jgi:membrane protein required for colicin V production